MYSSIDKTTLLIYKSYHGFYKLGESFCKTLFFNLEVVQFSLRCLFAAPLSCAAEVRALPAAFSLAEPMKDPGNQMFRTPFGDPDV